MVDVKISDLTAAGAATGAMQIEVNDGGTSKRITNNQLQDLIIGAAATGLVARTAANTVAQRSIANGNGIAVSNGDGVAGNPTVQIDYASQAEAEGLTDSIKGMNALRTSQAITKVGRQAQAKTGNFAAAASFRYLCDTSSVGITATLPASPTEGDVIVIRRIGANNVTISRNGNTIAGAASDLIIDRDKRGVTLEFINGGWRAQGFCLA